MLSLRLMVSTLAMLLTVPYLVSVVQQITRQAFNDATLTLWNSGNLVGVLTSYAAAALMMTGIAAAAQVVEFRGAANRLKVVREVFWWMGAASGLVLLYFAVNRWGTLLVDAKFGFLLAVTVCALASVQITRIKFPEYPFDPYIRGTRLNTSRKVRRSRGKCPVGRLPWGADFIEIEDEPKHCLLLGNVGGGKTTFLSMMMALTAHREELWIVFDPKTELVPFLSALGKKPLILNPLDKRSVAWALHKDIINPALAEAFAMMIIPDDESSDPYWTQSARNLLIGVIECFISMNVEWSFRDVILVCSNSNDLKNLLQRNPKNVDLIDTLNRKHEGGSSDYLLTLNNYLRRFHVIASLWYEASDRFSITELIQSQDFNNVAIVLGTDYSEGNTVNNLNRLIFERATQLISNLPDDRNRRIKLWLDEVSEASRYLNKPLVQFLTLARSKGGCAVLGAQNYAGLVDKFGEDAAQQILGIPHHKAILGGVDGQTAEWFSREVTGEVELIETEVGYSQPFSASDAGVDEGKRQKSSAREVSPSYKRVRRCTVSPEELLDSQIPQTGTTNGLTGFFAGGMGGCHWHHYEWAEIEKMRVKPDKDVSPYERIDEDSDAYYLKPWTAQEREALGLPPRPTQEQEGNSGGSGGSTLNHNFSHKPKR